MDAYPYTSYDNYRQKANVLGYFSEAMHENCLDMCDMKSDLPFLSV